MSEAKELKTECLLIVFAKTPVAGQVKTRIGALAGTEKAVMIYEYLLDTILTESASNDIWRQVIAITPESDAAFFTERGLEIMRQSGADIGERMSNALSQGFQCGACHVILIGSDIPDLYRCEIEEAFSRLDTVPAVIGPSIDGGFYLIGTTMEHCLAVNRILQGGISWSTPRVMDEVAELCQEFHLSLSLLPVKKDIDTYEDWVDYESHKIGKNNR